MFVCEKRLGSRGEHRDLARPRARARRRSPGGSAPAPDSARRRGGAPRTTSAWSAICGTHFGRDEARHLDLAQARARRRSISAILSRSGPGLLLVLQAVARTDLDDLDSGGVVHKLPFDQFGEHRGTGFAGPPVLPPVRGWAATRSEPTWGEFEHPPSVSTTPQPGHHAPSRGSCRRSARSRPRAGCVRSARRAASP